MNPQRVRNGLAFLATTVLLTAAGFSLGAPSARAAASEDDFLRPVGQPPSATAQRRQGGEALPPLPLPATPLRRSEQKHPPSPTTLVGKLIWGGHLDYAWPDGTVTRVYDWNMVPADAQALLRAVKERSGLEYQAAAIDAGMIPEDPAEMPVLLVSGGRRVRFTPEERARLRKYLLDGGMVWFDSVVGSPYFRAGAEEELRRILPEAPLAPLPPDHPLLNIARPSTAGDTNRGRRQAVILEGAWLGPRVAAVVSPHGLGGGWDNVYPQLIADADYYLRDTAVDVGVNLALYAVGWFDSGRRYAAGERETDDRRPAAGEKVPFGQLVTEGYWNSDPGAGERFLRRLAVALGVNVAGGIRRVDGEKDELADYPFLYLSGIGKYSLSDAARQRLRVYLDHGGFLWVNNTLGLSEFDEATRRFLAALYPDRPAERLGKEHPLFVHAPFPVAGSGFGDMATKRYPGEGFPLLYGVSSPEGQLRVVYSPVDLAGGWQEVSRPGSVAYTSTAAERLGMDIASYFLTH